MILNKIPFLILSISSLLASLFLQFYFANLFSSQLINLFYMGVTVCGVVISMSTSGISSYLISEFSSIKDNKLDIKNAATSFLIFFSILGILVFLFIYIVGCYVLNINEWAVLFFSFSFFIYFLSLAIGIVFQSYAYCHSRTKGVLSYEVLNFFSFLIVICIFYTMKSNEMLFYFIFCIRSLIQIAIYLVLIRHDLSASKFSFENFLYFVKSVRVIIGGSAYYKSEPVIDRFFIISNNTGIAVYHLVSQIYTAALGVWFKVYVSPLIKELTINNNNKKIFNEIYFHGLKKQIYFALLCGFLVFFTPMIDYISRIKIFKILSDGNDIITILFFFFVSGLLGQVISNVFYCVNKHSIPVVVSCITFTIFLPLKYVVTHKWGVEGLCVLVALYHFVNVTILFLISLRFRH
ncbi:hypothetical protein PCO86_18300 [Pectobacteriaceae bacterium CE70]|uniref:Wzx n=1 Tax=Serratia sp. (strain ATCC 39006) TaxID=104623 RepID=A0A2I5T4J3_SERS3|nr:polysaccharide biosynthesis protein [Serratia sp. ATCC 39006]AUG99488.1 hypothetical protein CWC46_06435 [Serratia sp. ATCC 39006]AUH03806.1 hypothetical protein Ser39006_006440 [Serratia sp. ATCC 39006]WJV66195.1 hypothetical protein PCO86_18300 [Pectobacteriaceae bacterium CE70]WJY10204.1 hypothetical protein PCO80_18240 [Pectobacteriaceae bacterium C80]